MIDYELYDRQLKIYDKNTMIKINNGIVGILGLEGGITTEICKNLILCGLKNLYLYDDGLINNSDIITGYYYLEKDIGKNRCQVLKDKLKELNSDIEVIINDFDKLHNCDVLVTVNKLNNEIINYNKYCRFYNKKFISVKCSNNNGMIFIDSGEKHIFTNKTGENYNSVQILNIDKFLNIKTNGHEFQTGDSIKLSNLQGINISILDNEFVITVIDKFNFKLNTDIIVSDNFIFVNGTATYIDKPFQIKHQDYETEILNPTLNFMSDINIIKNYVHSDIEIISINSIFGSIVASECIKLVTHKFEPLTQWFTYSDLDLDMEAVKNKLSETEFFIIGSGAIGCELLKNLAFLNVKKIYITDPDIIEKSNLSRQFLFGLNDIGELKSKVASNKIKQMKPLSSIEYFSEKVGYDNINFTNKILSNKNLIVMNALDNIEARKFMDTQCFNYEVPLFESATMGVKGNTQVVIPYLTETYSDSTDPIEEKTYPVCTIKQFPNEIHHTIHWALDKFEFFNRAPSNVNKWLKNKDMIFEQTSEGYERNNDIWLFTTKYNPSLFQENNCIIYIYWAIDIFYDYFYYEINDILKNYEPDKLTSEGNLFWSAGKRCPSLLILDPYNELHLNFIISTVNILCNINNIKFLMKKDDIINIINNNNQIKENYKKDNILLDINKNSTIDECISQIFEKDDNTNYHIMWINATSNLRATNYSIDIVDEYTTKIIAGKIIPAIATTTTLISSLITIEMLKYLNNSNDISKFRSTFINLALNTFIYAEPLPAKKIKIAGQEFNSWQKFNEKSNITLKAFLDKYNNLFKTNIIIASIGSLLIYADFLDENNLDKKLNEFISENDNIITILSDDSSELPNIFIIN